jgi:hypothetical protein
MSKTFKYQNGMNKLLLLLWWTNYILEWISIFGNDNMS